MERIGQSTSVIITSPQERKLGWSVDDVMPRRDGRENLRILKRQLVGLNRFSDQIRSDHIFGVSTGLDELIS